MIMFFPLHLSLPILKQQNQFPSSWFQLLLFSVFLYLPFVFYFFFYPLSRVNFLLYFSFSISPHPVISPSNRKIQSHFRQHASPPLSSLTSPRWLTSLSRWFQAGRGGRGEGAIFFDVWIRFFIYSIFYSRLFYIRGCDEMEVSAHLWPPLPGVSCWADFSPKASPVLQNLKKNLMVQK